MEEDYVENLLTEMESRVAAVEEKVFGDEIESKSQQKRLVIIKLLLLNAKMLRSFFELSMITIFGGITLITKYLTLVLLLEFDQ